MPALVVNATTINTGHGWRFTPHWMGESPWSTSDGADSVPRLEWSRYDRNSGWRMGLSRAVAASACVPFVFAPLDLGDGHYDGGIRVQLVDGGVYDTQGMGALLAHNCNVVLVSDACGQLRLQEQPDEGLKGLATYAVRSMDTLMERIRLASFGDLQGRQLSGLLRGLMFLHMKEGLNADTVRRKASQASYQLSRAPLAPSGVRRSYQQALSELRTDLDAFSDEESDALMACGYQMAGWSAQRSLKDLPGLLAPETQETWPFAAALGVISSHEAEDEGLLARLRAGRTIKS